MGLLSRIAEQREQQIRSHAAPYLEDDEEVVDWVRARHSEGKRGRGFVYLTSSRVVLVWTVGKGEAAHSEWHRIIAWGVNPETEGGPLLAVECEGEDILAKLPVTTDEMAQSVRGFLRRFADHAPSPRRTLKPRPHPGTYHSHAEVEVKPVQRNLASFTKRAIVTILGLILVIGGILMIPLPGPWSFPVIFGGLGILATEYDWADDMRDWVKRRSKQLAEKVRNRRKSKNPSAP